MVSKRRLAKKNGYDSGFEMDLATGPLSHAEYHPEKVTYTIPERQARYEPDFDVNGVLVEAKGRLRPGDPARYKLIFESLRERGIELVFVFEKPELPLPGAQKRKDGTKRSHAQWAEGIGARWFSKDNVGDLK